MSLAPHGPITANRVPVASYPTYQEAEKAVDFLSDHGFHVQGTLIVGVGLRSVEQVVSRMTYLRAIGLGAASGAWFGVLIGLFLGIFSPRMTIAVVLWGLIWGAIAGAIYGLISHSVHGGRRDFVSESGLVADKYEVLVESELVPRAQELLGQIGKSTG